MTFQKAQPEHADLVYQIKHEAYAAYAIQSRGFWDEVFQRRYTSDNLPHTQLIIVDDKPIGWIAVHEEPDALDILDIHILPSHQRQGIGTAAVRRVLEDARAENKCVKLSVLKINPSRALYERLGFCFSGETESHWLMEHSEQQLG